LNDGTSEGFPIVLLDGSEDNKELGILDDLNDGTKEGYKLGFIVGSEEGTSDNLIVGVEDRRSVGV